MVCIESICNFQEDVFHVKVCRVAVAILDVRMTQNKEQNHSRNIHTNLDFKWSFQRRIQKYKKN